MTPLFGLGDNAPKDKKIILLIDLDGTAADWYGQLREELVRKFPEDKIPTLNELTGYFWEDNFDKKYHIAIDAITEAKGFYRKLKPYPDAITAFKDMEENCQDWLDPHICTKPSSGYEDFLCHSEKIQWVNEYLGPFWANRTILSPDKTLVHGDYLIDDHPNITGSRQEPTWQQILYDQPYNRVAGIPGFTWKNWEGLKKLLRAEKPNTRLNDC